MTLESALEAIVGPKGGPMPDHAMLALGALSSLRTKDSVPPAQKAAIGAIEMLESERPDVSLPPPELVAEAVAKLQAEHERRVAEAEAEEAAAKEMQEQAAKEEADAKAKRAEKKAERELKPVAEGTVEEVDDDDDDDDGLEVI